MTAHTFAASNPDGSQSFEEGSSSEGSSNDYETPDDDVDENVKSPDEGVREALHEADELKAEGTEFFRSGLWLQALQSYRRGLTRLPPRNNYYSRVEDCKGKTREGLNLDVGPDGRHTGDDDSGQTERPEGVQQEDEQLSQLERDCAKARSILNGNIAACHVKLGEHTEAVQACSQALLDDPHYVKALHRRATSNDLLGTWSSLASAEEDYNELMKILPTASPLLPQIRQGLHQLKPRREAAQKAEMAEMMGKLKGLGNSVLGNFGLSTDNFKFEPNGQGGYSMNFVR